ncbi:MAG TPA: glycosyltransferase family 2 protein [Halanaerobiales bacterium]|nr:glycosyltransferase family 2 protein [Halanaerobiales bacterium]
MNKDISIVVPIYYEEENIFPLYERLKEVVANEMGLDYEIIFINDGSKDDSVKNIKKLREQDDGIKLINFSRNFGHQVAVTAGLEHTNGEVSVIIDADLQDPPELIIDMYEKYKEGYDVVYAKRKSRAGESFFKKKTAKVFYRLLDFISEVDIPLDTGDYRLISKRVVAQLNNMTEKNRFIRGLVTWVGFKQTYVEYNRDERYAGETGYSLSKMIKFSLDGITSFSTFPLKIATIFGTLISGVSFIYILRIIYLKYFTEKTIQGWSSIMVSNLFLGGIILLTLGILGEYIGRIYTELKNRPQYIIKDKYGFSEEEKDAER